MLRSFAAGVTLALSLASLAPSAQAQVRERDVTITGPRGNSIKRQFESVRTPGGLTREMTITRPAGTYHRELNVTRPPSVVGGGPRGWGYPPVRNDVYIERDVIVPPPRPFVPGFSSFNLSLGLPLLPPPPPPPAVIYQPAPVVVAQPGVVNVPAPSYAVSTSVGVDPVAEAIGRLSSFHSNSRRDGAYILGRLGDPRAVAPLIDRLKHDKATDVRIAAATAIGQIGEPSTAIILERAIPYDEKQEVRDAAALALSKMPKVVEHTTTSVAATPPRSIVSRPATAVNRSAASSNTLQPLPEPAENVPPPPTPSEPKE